MKKSFALTFTILTLALTTAVSARVKRLKLPYYGEHLRGQNTLFLKQKIREFYPGINLRQAELEKVILVAKTRMGHGTVALRVGPDVGAGYTVGGNPGDFHDRGYFYRVRMDNYRGSRGPWQLKLRGNFKIKKVIVVINTRNHRPSRPMVTKSCTYELRSLFGKKLLQTFYGQASGYRGTSVKERACDIARNKCYDFKDSFGDFGSLGRCKERY